MLAAYVPILWASHVGTSVAISPLELVRYSLEVTVFYRHTIFMVGIVKKN